MPNDLQSHCDAIDQCNQRGGRMLSIVNLLHAETFTPELAAYALATISRSASSLVGALPGGAGKTTVMGALLNFVPPDVPLIAADSESTIADGISHPTPRRCYICHEIGAGHYYCYLWGQQLRDYFRLAEAGHMLATNLHADTYEQAKSQICRDNDVSEAALRRINLMFFLSVRRGAMQTVRRIAEVWESDGQSDHRRVWPGNIERQTRLVTPAQIAAASQTIDEMLEPNLRTIEEVRRFVVSRVG